jgi:hypothetical protein
VRSGILNRARDRAVSGPSPFGRLRAGSSILSLTGRGEDKPPAGPRPHRATTERREITGCSGHPCQPLSSRYAIILIVLLSPIPTNALTTQHSTFTKMHSPLAANLTPLIVRRRALPNLFLHSSWTSDEEMEEKENVNQNFPITCIFISEQCLFGLAQTVSLSYEIGRTVFMLNVNHRLKPVPLNIKSREL